MPYNDYPQEVSDNARRGIELNDAVDGRCATDVGKETARILANREMISEERTVRMFSFLSRARTYYNPDDTEACGTISYLLWGGDAGLSWAADKVEDMNETEEDEEDDDDMEDNTRNNEAQLRARYGDNVEVRAVEVRAQEDMTIEGYASVFGDEYDLGYFTERVAPGAFDGRTNDDVRLLINHTGVPLARTTNNTLTLTIDERGLHYRAKLADTQEGRDLYTLIQRGDITQSSFAFTIAEDEWSGDRRTRTINRVGQLYDVSPVTYPASPTTTVQAREMATYTQPEPAPAPVTEAEPEIVATPIFERKSDKFQTMNLNDMKALRANKISQLSALSEGATLQARGYTEGEETTIDTLTADIAELDAKIERAEKVEAQVARAAFGAAASKSEVVEQSKIQERYSISKLVRESMTGRLTGLEAEMSQQAAADLKNAGVGVRGLAQIPGFILRNTSTIGGTNVPGQSNTNVLEALVPTPILEQAGANVLRGLAGNINLPSLNDGTDIINETASATGAAAIAARQLSPQRVASRIDITNELLAAMNQSIDATVQRQFARASAAQIDEMFLVKVIAAAASTFVKRNETAAANVAGLTSQVASGLIGALGNANALTNSTAFITSHGLLATARYTPTVSGGAIPIMQDNAIFGYNAYGTSLAAAGLITDANYDIYSEVYANSTASTTINNEADLVPIVIANMENCYVAYWGGGAADLVIDPYTLAATGITRLILNMYADADFAHTGDVRFTVGA
jgi:HK97 family phage prohead protease/HK97 family phage major capsid protein